MSIACALAKGLTLANERVVDAYGGFCGTPSKYLPAPAPAKAVANTTTTTAAATNTTANATANTTANATRILADAAATNTT